MFAYKFIMFFAFNYANVPFYFTDVEPVGKSLEVGRSLNFIWTIMGVSNYRINTFSVALLSAEYSGEFEKGQGGHDSRCL